MDLAAEEEAVYQMLDINANLKDELTQVIEQMETQILSNEKGSAASTAKLHRELDELRTGVELWAVGTVNAQFGGKAVVMSMGMDVNLR